MMQMQGKTFFYNQKLKPIHLPLVRVENVK